MIPFSILDQTRNEEKLVKPVFCIVDTGSCLGRPHHHCHGHYQRCNHRINNHHHQQSPLISDHQVKFVLHLSNILFSVASSCHHLAENVEPLHNLNNSPLGVVQFHLLRVSVQRNHFAISPHFMVWAPDGGKGHLQNWISGDSQTTAFQTCHNWIMKIETSIEIWDHFFMGRKTNKYF